MIKKISLTALFVLFAGLLIYGAINRTAATSQRTARAASNGSAAGLADLLSELSTGERAAPEQGQQRQGQGSWRESGTGDGQGYQAQGRGLGAGQGAQGQGRQAQNTPQQEAVQQITITGAVIQAPQPGIDIILATDDGELTVGTGPGYLDEQGFLIQQGDTLEIVGFWESELFKPIKITRLDDGESVLLRDEWGRPMWSGGRRNGRSGQNSQDGI